MVRRCQDKGLHAPVMDFGELDDPEESFDIVDFHIAQEGTPRRFQSLTLRRPGRASADAG